MFNQDENQEETGRNYNISQGLGGNLVPEGNENFEEEQISGQFGQNSKGINSNIKPPETGHDSSFHVDKIIDDFSKNKNFEEKEKKMSQHVDQFLKGKGYSISTFSNYTFMFNKILFLTTFTEFLFQRFDIVTLFLCIVIILIEAKIFSHKHLYKWLIVLVSTLLLDALVLLDISPAGDTYLESGAGSTMLKFGLLILLANIFLKLLVGIGLWSMAMDFKSGEAINFSEKYDEEQIEAGNPEILRGQNNNNGRIIPQGNNGNDFELRQSNQDNEE